MTTPTNAHRPAGVAPNPWLGRLLVAMAALVAAWSIATVVDGGRDTTGPQPAAGQADVLTASQAAAAERLAAQAATGAAVPATPAPAPAPSDIFEVRDLDLVAGGAAVAPAPAPAPSDIFDYRQFSFIPGSGLGAATVEQLAAYDVVSGSIPDIVPFDQQRTAEQLAGYDLVSGDIPDVVPFDHRPANPQQEMR